MHKCSGSFIQNSQKLETIHMFMNKRIDTLSYILTMESISARKGNKLLIHVATEFQNLSETKPDLKSMHAVRFHLRKAQKQAKLIYGDNNPAVLNLWRGARSGQEMK